MCSCGTTGDFTSKYCVMIITIIFNTFLLAVLERLAEEDNVYYLFVCIHSFLQFENVDLPLLRRCSCL